jgi:RHS repeat-associated protein
VLVTISDKKLAVASTTDPNLIAYYNADVVTANDYYPFGSQMPGRKFSQPNSSYRYGFNGKENDNSTGEGNLDFGARIYDCRLGRFLTVDPLTREYVSSTPYSFAANNPILLIDSKGKFPIIPWLIKGATGAVISATLQFTINYIVTENASEAFNNINWWQAAADGAQSMIPWNPPGGKWGKAAVSSVVSIGANALNGNYNGMSSAETLKAVSKDFIVSYLSSIGTHAALDKLGKYLPKIADWLAKSGLDAKTIKKLTNTWGSASSKLESKVANYLDGIKNGTVEDVNKLTKQITYKGVKTQEIDVVTKSANIEVKEGTSISGKQLEQLINTSKAENKIPILFAPEINDKTTNSLIKQFPGLQVIRSWAELGKKAVK